MASPIPSETTKVTNKEMINMAVTGIRTILNACKQNKIEKLIVTSSCATINGGVFKGKKDIVYTEEDFAFGKPNQKLDGYMNSKIL